jgi:hypothetical protein
MQTKINWIGLAGGITTVALIIVSLFNPWWQITAGEDLVKANVSPLNTNFNFLGTTFTVPLIWALTLASLLTLVASGIAMLVYSITPTKAYSKHLLGFAYKKPLFALLLFVIVLYAITVIIQTMFGLNVPLMGSATATLPQTMTYGATIKVLISTGFQWPFWLAAIAAGLCIAARLYHKRIATAQVSVPTKAELPTATVT